MGSDSELVNRRYKSEYLRYDIVSGLTVGIVAIPQGMANSLMANMPPVYGLYGAIMPVLFHSLFTSSRHIHVGPYAVCSLMCASLLSFIDHEHNEAEFNAGIITIAFLSGVFLILLGVLKLGGITRILSNAVVTSFTSSSAIQIIACQLGGFLDVSTGSGSTLSQFKNLFSPAIIAKYNYYALIIGISSTILLFIGKYLNKRFCPKMPLPIELFLVILYIFLVWAFDLKQRWNIKLIGDTPTISGFPPLSSPSPRLMLRLLPGSVMIAIVCFSTYISVAKAFAQQFDYHVDDSQELVALGVSQLGGAFFSGIPGTCSITRSSIAANLGVRSPVFSLVALMVVLSCLLFCMDLIAFLPKAVLTSIVIVNLVNMLKRFHLLPRFYRTCRPDFWSFGLCTVVLVVAGAEYGLVAGVAGSLLLLLLAVKTTKKEVLQPLEGEVGGVVVDAGDFVHFLNCDTLVNRVNKELHTVGVRGGCHVQKSKDPVCVDLRRVSYIDTSGLNVIAVGLRRRDDG